MVFNESETLAMMIAYQGHRLQDSREGGRSHDEYDRNAIHRRTAGDPGGKDMENKLAENIRSYRKNRGLTQEQLAERLGITLGTVSKWERGSSEPDLGFLMDLAELFQVSVDALIGFSMRGNDADEEAERIKSLKKAVSAEAAAEEVLVTREYYPDKTLAELYDPDKMPQNLREAHTKLDDIVESCYPGYPFASDEARLECLFKLYEKMTSKH